MYEKQMVNGEEKNVYHFYGSQSGKHYKLIFIVDTYAMDPENIAVEADMWDEEYKFWDTFAVITKNIVPIDKPYAAIDNNNLSQHFIDWLREEGIIDKETYGCVPSGYCVYDIVKFDEKFLEDNKWNGKNSLQAIWL